MLFSISIPQVSAQGHKKFGQLLKQSRQGRSLDDAIKLIKKQTGLNIAKSTLSHLEHGHSEPTLNTLSLLAHSLLADYTIYQLIDILMNINT